MNRKLKTTIFICMLANASSGYAAPTTIAQPKERGFLTCPEVRSRINLFLDLHIRFRDFNDELSRRSFSKLFELLDPEKNYFLSSDIDSFQPVADRLDDLIQRGNCSFIDGIHKLFIERVKDRAGKLGSVLDMAQAQAIQAGVSDQGKQNLLWAKNTTELDERWLKKSLADGSKIREIGATSFPTQRLLRRYQRASNRILSQTHDELLSAFLNAFALSLDPHSAHFLPPAQDEFNSHLGVPLDGVGLILTDDEDVIAVESIEKDGPADKSNKIKRNDQIISLDNLDGTPPIDVSQHDAIKVGRLLRGKKGSKIKLDFQRPATVSLPFEKYSVVLTRDTTRLKSISVRSELVKLRTHKIGVLKLPSFYTDAECGNRIIANCHGATAETRTEIEKLKKDGAEGLVLDIRNNSGGDLLESIRFTGLFVGKGPILQSVDRSGTPRIQSDPDPRIQFTGPLVVLVNKNSASASEIVTAALKDYARAIVVGDSRTFGKGSIQIIQDLSSQQSRMRLGMIKITQAKFYGPSGNSTQNKGVASDIVIPSKTESEVETEDKKEYVLDWDHIKAAPGFKPIANIESVVKDLRAKSLHRTNSISKISEDSQIQEAEEILADALDSSDQTRMLSISSYDL